MGKKKTKTTSNQQTSLTTTPTNPEWSTGLVSGLAGRVNDLSKADPYSFIAGPDALQTQAGAGAADLTPSANYGQASDIYSGLADGGPGAADIAGGISKFYNPYEQQVVDTSLADYDFGAGQSRGQAALDLANDTTFGGSGGSLYRSGLEGEILRGRGALSAGIRSDGFKTALGGATAQAQLAEQAAARQLQSRLGAAGGLASVGQAQGADERANIGLQANIGDILQKLAQQRAGAPLGLLGTQASLAGTLPLGMFTGQQANGTMSGTSTSKTSGASLGDWLGFFAANAQAAAAGAGG